MSFLNKLKEGASKAADKAKDSVEYVRLNAQISTQRKEIEKYYTVIGEAVFQAYVTNDLTAAESVIKEQGAKISECLNEIEELEDKINFIKDEKDCVCGVLVPLESKFCPSCGNKFEFPIEAEAVAEAETNTIVDATINSNTEVINAETTPIELKICTSCGSSLGQEDTICEKCGSDN